MNHKLSIQIYSVRDKITTPDDTAQAFRALRSYGYTGLQTAGAQFVDSCSEYARLANDAGLEIIGTHIGMENFDDITKAVEMHRVLGTTNAGIGGMPLEARTSKAAALEFVDRANAIGEQLSKFGMKFTYHHHSFEFARVDGGSRLFDLLVDGFDKSTVSFVLDTYWLQHAGVSPVDYIYKLAGRVDILHLKDKGIRLGENDGHITELGSGNLDFAAIVKAADDTGITHLCYEQDSSDGDSLESAKKSAEYFYANF